MQRDPSTTGHGKAILDRCLAFTVLCAALIVTGCSHPNAAASTATCTGNVCSYDTIYGAVTMQSSAGTFASAEIVTAPAAAPSAISAPFGWFSFKITGLTTGATVTLTFSVPGGFTLTGYEKCIGTTCSALPGVILNGTALTVMLTDGGSGDADGAANGTITDPSALLAITSSSSSTAALTGIGVVPSDFSSCTLSQVVTGTVTPVAELMNLSFQPPSPTLTANYPFAAVFEMEGTAVPVTVSLFGLPLVDSNDATLPTPTQIGTFAVSPEALCGGIYTGYANVLSPSSAYFIVQTVPATTTGTCAAPNTVLINYTDSSTTAPTQLTTLTTQIPSANYADLYSFPSGQLSAEVLLTGVGGNLIIYPPNSTTGTPDFTAGISLLPGDNLVSVEHHPIFLNRSGQAMSTVLFEKVVADVTDTPNFLYRIDGNTINNAPISPVYSAVGTLQMSPIVFNNTNTVFDNTNIYFVDVVPNPNLPGAYIYNFFEAPLAGGPATQIGTASPPLDALYSMVDTDGTNLILEFEYLATSPMTFGLYSLSVTGSATQSPTPLLEYNVPGAASLNAFLDYGSDHLFVNEVQSGTMSTTTSLVFAPSSATPLLGPTPTTSFVQWLPVIAGSPTNDTVLQFQNLPSDGTDGDALLNDMTADTLIPTTLSLNGSPYIVPAQNTVTLTPVSNTIAQGAQFGIGTTSSAGGCNSSGSGSSSGGAAFWLPYLESESNSGSSPNAVSSVGLAVNVSNNQIITIAPPADTNLSPF